MPQEITGRRVMIWFKRTLALVGEKVHIHLYSKMADYIVIVSDIKQQVSILLFFFFHLLFSTHVICYQLNCVPLKSYILKSQYPLSWNVAILGDRAFKEKIRLSEAFRMGPNPI